MALTETFASEWQAVSQVPFLFGAALLTISGASIATIRGTMRWLYANRVEKLKSLNKILSDTNNEYKRKLDVQSPQEAEDKLLTLESRVQTLELKTETEADVYHRRMLEAAAQGKDVFIGGKPLGDR